MIKLQKKKIDFITNVNLFITNITHEISDQKLHNFVFKNRKLTFHLFDLDKRFS